MRIPSVPWLGWAALSQKIKGVRPGLWLLPVLLFAGMYLWRPFTLGFYTDDWSTLVESGNHGGPFSLERLDWHSVRLRQWRPLVTVFHWITTSIFGSSSIAWQFFLIALIALSCFMLYRFVRVLGAGKNAAAVVAGLWLVCPWSVGYNTWPIFYLGFISLVFFLAGSIALLRRRIWAAVAWYLAGMLTYEAFHFLWVFVLVFLIVAAETRRWALRRALPALVVLQGLMVAGNRIAAHFWPRGSKPVGDDWLVPFARALYRLPVTLADTISGGRVVGLITISLTAIAAVVSALLLRDRKRQIGLLAALVASVAALAIFAAAGYLPSATAHSARTTVAATVWMMVFLALCWRPGGIRRRWMRLAAGVAVATLVVVLSVSTIMRTTTYERWWSGQEEVLAAVPAADVAAAGPQAMILVIGLPSVDGIPVFADNWAMSAAVANRYPETRVGDLYRLFMQARSVDAIRWDGTQWFRYDQFEGKTDEMWLWLWPEPALQPMIPDQGSS